MVSRLVVAGSMYFHYKRMEGREIINTPLVPSLHVKVLEYSLKLKINRNDWLLADTCPKAANNCALF